MPQENHDNIDNMTDEELEIYLSVIRSAYPAPKTDIKSSVMDKISDERRNTKILGTISTTSNDSSAERKRAKLKKVFVRYASLAACAVIVCLAGIKILPALTSKDIAKDEAEILGPALDMDLEVSDEDLYYSASDNSGDPYKPEADAAPSDSASNSSNPFTVCDGNTNNAPEHEAVKEKPEMNSDDSSDATVIAMFEDELRNALSALDPSRFTLSESEVDASQYTIGELIVLYECDKDTFDDLYEKVAEKYRTEYPDVTLPVYNVGE